MTEAEGTPRLSPASTLIAIIDVQERLAAAMPVAQLTEMTRAIALLLEAGAQLGAPVVATEQYPKGLGKTLPPIAERLAASGAVPVEKMTFSAVDAPAFVERVLAVKPRVVVVAGMETHVCVFQTVRDLVARGLDVHVPIDGVASRREDHRQAGIRLCERAGATLTTAETIVFDWLERAGTDAFRAVAKLVK